MSGRQGWPSWKSRPGKLDIVFYYLGHFDENADNSCKCRGYFSLLEKIKSMIHKT